jgi:hypothetical protein
VQVNATVPVNPPVDPTVTLAIPDWPGATELGFVVVGAETLKSGAAGFSVSEGCTLNCSSPDAPVIVIA